MQHATTTRSTPAPGDLITYALGKVRGHATVVEVYNDLLNYGDQWYLTTGNPRWVSKDQVINPCR